jgi:hypothetical protein
MFETSRRFSPAALMAWPDSSRSRSSLGQLRQRRGSEFLLRLLAGGR